MNQYKVQENEIANNDNLCNDIPNWQSNIYYTLAKLLPLAIVCIDAIYHKNHDVLFLKHSIPIARRP